MVPSYGLGSGISGGLQRFAFQQQHRKSQHHHNKYSRRPKRKPAPHTTKLNVARTCVHQLGRFWKDSVGPVKYSLPPT